MNRLKGRYFTIRKKVKQKIDAGKLPKRWDQDPKGYFLIKVDRKKRQIVVGYVTRSHILTKVFTGTNAEDLYYAIADKNLLSRFTHAAYLGKELHKAEIALKTGKKYVQG